MAVRIVLGIANPALDANGKVDAGATLTFYVNGTTTLQSIYTDATLDTPLANPLDCDAAGRFPQIWAPENSTYSVKWIPTGASSITYDDITGTFLQSGTVYQFASTAVLLTAFSSSQSLADGTLAQTAGRTVKGLGGASFYYDASDSSAADNGGTIRVDGQGRRWKIIFSGPAFDTWFGTDPSGTSDSTGGMLAFLNYIFNSGGFSYRNGAFSGGGTYLITGAIQPNWDGASNFTLDWADATFIQQTDNVPCLLWQNTAGSDMKFWNFRGRPTFKWKNNQPAANINALGIMFSNANAGGAGWHDFNIEDIVVSNGYGAIGNDPTGVGNQIQWQFYIRSIKNLDGLYSGILVNLGGAQGSPIGRIGQIYGHSTNSALPMFSVGDYDCLIIEQVERNLAGTSAADAGIVGLITSGRNVTINQIRVEDEVYGASMSGRGLIESSALITRVGVEGISLQGLTINVGSGSVMSVARQVGVATTGQIISAGPVWADTAGSSEPLIFTSGRLGIVDPGLNGATAWKFGADAVPSYPGDLLLSPFVDNLVHVEGTSEIAFYGTSVDAASATAIPVNIGGKVKSWAAGYSGRVTGISIQLSAALTQGSVDFQITINGTPIYGGTAIATLASPHQATTGALGLWNFSGSPPDNTFNIGDVIGVIANASSAPLPANTDASIVVYVAKGF